MKHKSFIIIGLLVALVSMLAVAVPAQSAALQAPRIRLENGASLNWAGYAVEYPNLSRPKNGTVSDVTGTWQVPEVRGGTVSGNTYSSIWVGIDGYSNNTVEQIGTEEDWINGSAVYFAWYEMYPKYPVTIPLTINAKDIIEAEVGYATSQAGTVVGKSAGKGKSGGGTSGGSGYFILTLTDETSGESFTTTQTSASAKRSSAEWIVEAPWSAGVLPLADFGTATFSNASLTINGVTSSDIANWGSNTYDRIDMVNSSGNLKAQTSVLASDGSGFTVTWKSN
jgi:hypothetical protein